MKVNNSNNRPRPRQRALDVKAEEVPVVLPICQLDLGPVLGLVSLFIRRTIPYWYVAVAADAVAVALTNHVL